uniref:Uncharacterized protein n=1 Tax=Arundo donax TaxID=35708 RepID=A0A0A9BZ95_ARUDO
MGSINNTIINRSNVLKSTSPATGWHLGGRRPLLK